MLAWLRERAQDRETAVDLYGAVVAEARQPLFFTHGGVPDSPEGRAGLIILVLFPLLERLQAAGQRARRVARLMSEAYVTDIDDCLREMGVGDLAVPKKVKRAAQALAERCRAYAAAGRAPDPVTMLAAEIATTIPGLEAKPAGAESLARYVLATAAELRALPDEALLAKPRLYPLPVASRFSAGLVETPQ